MKNTISIILTLDATGLRMMKTIPTFCSMLYSNQIKTLMIGENALTVSKPVYSKMKRLLPINDSITFVKVV